MKNIEIKKVTLNDIGALQKIGRRTFSETFSKENTEENMIKYLEESFSPDKLEAEVNAATSQFYFATLNGEIIGYLKLNTGNSQTELQDNKAVEIERIYVLKVYHGKKVGQLLYEKAMQIAQDIDADYVWYGKKIQEPSVFTRKTALQNLTSIFSS